MLNSLFQMYFPNWYLNEKHLVSLPELKSAKALFASLATPDWSALYSVKMYSVALTIALIGSLETLLSVEATDKLDTEKRSTPTKRELIAQGFGNMVSGLIGGLPITQVIVRSSANVNAGGKNKLATIFHGILLLISVLFLAPYLNMIPLSSLAAILIIVGYKLAKVSIFQHMYKLGMAQFIPFCVTIIAVLLSDLLKGITIGFLIALIAAIMQKNQRFNSYGAVFTYLLTYLFQRKFRNNLHIKSSNNDIEIVLLRKVTFLNKARLNDFLSTIKSNSKVKISARKNAEFDQDIVEVISHFQSVVAPQKQIKLELVNIELTNALAH
jgi:MFS superfamily sulfate permease-like transporter